MICYNLSKRDPGNFGTKGKKASEKNKIKHLDIGQILYFYVITKFAISMYLKENENPND